MSLFTDELSQRLLGILFTFVNINLIHVNQKGFHKRRISKKKTKNMTKSLTIQHQEEMQDKDFLNKISADEKDDFCPEKRKDQLCVAIRNIILIEKNYRNPKTNRNYFIERLGTNKDLFVEVFQHCFGMSFTECINNLRLKDSILLLERSDLSIEAISEKVGFGTVRTFQRQFQAKYNMSPKNYRKSLKEKHK